MISWAGRSGVDRHLRKVKAAGSNPVQSILIDNIYLNRNLYKYINKYLF